MYKIITYHSFCVITEVTNNGIQSQPVPVHVPVSTGTQYDRHFASS